MKQKIAIGASWTTSPISRIATSSTPSIASFSTSVRGVCTSSRPMPKNSAKNITARMSFADMAEIMLLGTILTSRAMPASVLAEVSTMPAAPSLPWASISAATAGSTPSPGRITFTTASDITTAMVDTTTV